MTDSFISFGMRNCWIFQSEWGMCPDCLSSLLDVFDSIH